MSRTLTATLLFAALIFAPGEVARAQTAVREASSVVRVNATVQMFDFARPWLKKPPVARRALGAVLADGKVLVTADCVAFATFVELEKPAGGEKVPAEVVSVDPEANLALVRPTDAAFLKGFSPLEVAEADAGERAAVWQLEGNGALLATEALLTTVEVGRYPLEETQMLVYRFSCPLQYRENSFTVPVASGRKLFGLVMRYDARGQTADAIPAPVIARFVADAADGDYRGFPSAGVSLAPMRDPAFRAHVGWSGSGGVYVTDTIRGSGADRAGIAPGDVIVQVAGQPIDADGNYLDERHGRLALSHLIACGARDGETVPFTVWRSGTNRTIDVTVARRAPQDSVVPPYTLEAPRYRIVGGLILLELSRAYLREWGDWQKKAPLRLVYIDRFQRELYPDGNRRVVVLSQVLPSPITIGYEGLDGLVVQRLNGVELRSLDDVATALKQPENGFHKFELEEAPRLIFLDAAEVSAAEPKLKEAYGIPSLERL
jgi:S1-C subfamily serine protease